MRFSAILSLIPLAGLVAALQVTEPTKGEDFKASDSITVKWTSVNTDVSSFNLYLVNNAVYPPVSKEIATNVKTSDGSYTIKDISSLSVGSGYQINLESDSTQNTGILAQSQQFNVTAGSASSSSSSSSSSTASSTETSTDSSSTATGTTTGTATTTGSMVTTTSTGTSTGTKTSSSGSSTASGTSSSTASPTGNAGVAVMARPAAAVGVLIGALALAL